MLRTIALPAGPAGTHVPARRARLLIGLAALAATLSGCDSGSPPPTPNIGKELLPAAGPRCAAAFAADPPSGSPAPGSVSGPAVALIKYGDAEWGPYYGGNVFPSRAEAKSPDTVQTLVCVRDTRIQVGVYQPGDVKAMRIHWDVRVLRWPGGEVVSGMSFEGSDPPSTVERQHYQQYATETGTDPHGAYSWLDQLIAR